MLTQSEADALIAMPKKRADDENYQFPNRGKSLTIPIISDDGRESFLLDVNRGGIRLTKCTFQERYEKIIVLVRLDIDGPPHTNPEVVSIPASYLEPYNGATMECPHLHLYVEGFNDSRAMPVPADKFPRTHDLYKTLYDFFSYCNISRPPAMQGGLSIC